jgi:hypothetical protein
MGRIMTRGSFLAGAAMLVCLVVLPASASSAQAHPNVVGVGITHCNGAWTGTLAFSPPLLTGGTATTEGVSITGVAASCTGGTPPPTSGKLDGKAVITGAGANNCSNYFATPAPPGGIDTLTFSPNFNGAIYWTPTSISPSSYSFAAMTAITTSTAATVRFKAPVVSVTGSYPTAAGKFAFNTVKLLGTILGSGSGNCASTSGLSNLRIAAAGSSGKF